MLASMFSFCSCDLNFCVIMYLLLHLQLLLVGLLQVLLALLLLPQRLDVHIEVHHVALDLEGQFSIGSTTLDCFLTLLVFATSLATNRRSDSFCEDDSDSFAWSMQIACRCQVSNFAGEGSRSRSASP